MLPCTSLGKECVEGVVPATNRLIAGHLSIRLDSVLKAEQFPTSVTDLNTSLANVDAESLRMIRTGVNLGSNQTVMNAKGDT